MKKSKRDAAKQSAQEQQQQRRAQQLRKAEEEYKKSVALEHYIAKDNTQRKSKLQEYGKSFLDPFWKVIEKKAPKLLDKEYFTAVNIIHGLERQRDIADWSPRGKGRDAQFNSLAEYLLAKYPMPQFLWSAFWEPDVEILKPIVIHIARGGSLAKLCQTGEFPLPLTKKQCHAFLQTNSDYTFMSALRAVQIRTYEGSQALLRVWMNRYIGRRLQSKENEVFWDSVLSFLCKNPMLDMAQVGPLIDYILYRRDQDLTFSMKGRSVLAMIRGMNEWHGDLARKRIYKEHNYTPSGFKEGCWGTKNKDRFGNSIENRWFIEEILTIKDLLAEGRAHHHCVYSYSQSIDSGHSSIWSMTCNGEKVITIEVRKSSNAIVQARGKYNRDTTAQEFRVLQAWASENGLVINLDHW